MGNEERMRPQTAPGAVAAEAQTDDHEIDLLELLYRVLANIKYVVVASLICALLAFIYTSQFVTPLYSSTAKLYVMGAKDSAINLSDLQIGTYLTKDYQKVFETWEVHEQVLQNLGLDYSYAKIQSMLSISNPSDTRMIYITATSADPQEAANIANEYANVAKAYIANTMETEQPNTLSVARVPTSPVSPSIAKNTVLGFLVGAVISVGIIFLLFMMDDKIKTADDISRFAGISTLSIVPVQETLKAQSAKNANRRR